MKKRSVEPAGCSSLIIPLLGIISIAIALLTFVTRDMPTFTYRQTWGLVKSTFEKESEDMDGNTGTTRYVTFSYQVNQRSYSATEIYDRIKKVKQDDTINIYYNPRKPQETTLIRGISIYTIIFLMFGIFILWLYFRMLRGKN